MWLDRKLQNTKLGREIDPILCKCVQLHVHCSKTPASVIKGLLIRDQGLDQMC